jgi:hypothetical protein
MCNIFTKHHAHKSLKKIVLMIDRKEDEFDKHFNGTKEVCTYVEHLKFDVLSEYDKPRKVYVPSMRHLLSFSKLKCLELHDLKLGSISELSSLTNLEELIIHYCASNINLNQLNFKCLLPLKKFRKLEFKYIRGSWDISSLSSLVQLKELTISSPNEPILGDDDFDINLFQNLTNLEVLCLTEIHCPGEIDMLSNMTNLKKLTLVMLQVEGDISALESCRNLTEIKVLDCFGLQGDLSSLSGLIKLEVVYMHGTRIEGNVSSLSNLAMLKKCSLGFVIPLVEGSRSSLSNLKHLEEFYLKGEAEESFRYRYKKFLDCPI